VKLVIPVDGSESSKHAIRTTMENGLFENAEIHLITVNPLSGDIPASPYMALNMMDQIVKVNKKKALDILEEATALIAPKYSVAAAVVKQGDPAQEIIKYSCDLGSNLIVMGNRGLGTFNKILLGSVSQQVLTHSKCSVLIVKKKK
jgi:nucleotide-binding universal stress UspA family protein